MQPVIGCRLDELDTPAALVDLDVLEANIERMATFARMHGVALRPHAKLHESAVGERLRFVPDHACTTANLAAALIGLRGERVAEILPVIARGGRR